jgi:Fatty acid desaturase
MAEQLSWKATTVAQLLQTLFPAGLNLVTFGGRISMAGNATSQFRTGEAEATPDLESALPRLSLFQRFEFSASWRYGSANLLLLLGSASLLAGGLVPWSVLGVAMVLGSFADEFGGDDRTTLNHGTCWFCKINLYLSLPLVCILAAMLIRFTSSQPGVIGEPFALIGAVWLSGYLFALVGATVAHELCHRTRRIAKLFAYALLGFTGNASFVTYHLYAHHRQVGTLDDAATARRGERLRTFMARTLVQQFVQAIHIEAAQLRRLGLSPWSWRNRVILAHIAPLTIIVLAGVFAGARGAFVVLAAGLLGRLFHELINYVQHFGIVRIENHPVKEHHSWDCHRTISNSLHYNLPRHSDHHMAATKDFWRLQAHDQAPMLPYGYQTMAFIALTPPLWRHIMRRLLADWDEHYASEAERELVRQRGWDGIA